jgi:hypothetical protein
MISCVPRSFGARRIRTGMERNHFDSGGASDRLGPPPIPNGNLYQLAERLTLWHESQPRHGRPPSRPSIVARASTDHRVEPGDDALRAVPIGQCIRRLVLNHARLTVKNRGPVEPCDDGEQPALSTTAVAQSRAD